jgi:hypothetical protein
MCTLREREIERERERERNFEVKELNQGDTCFVTVITFSLLPPIQFDIGNHLGVGGPELPGGVSPPDASRIQLKQSTRLGPHLLGSFTITPMDLN